MDLIAHWSQDSAVRAACGDFGDGAAIIETAIAIQQIPAPTYLASEPETKKEARR